MIWDIAERKRLMRFCKKINKTEKYHYEKLKVYLWRHNLLMGLCIFLGPLSGFLSGIGTTVNPDADVLFPIMASSVGFVSGLVIAYTKFSGYKDLASNHEQMAVRYKALRIDIQHQTALRFHTGSVDEYINNLYAILSALYSGEEPIPRAAATPTDRGSIATLTAKQAEGAVVTDNKCRQSDFLTYEMKRLENKMRRYHSNLDSPRSNDLNDFADDAVVNP